MSSPNKIQQQLKAMQKLGIEVNWLVHSHGVATATQVLKACHGHNLDKHTFLILSPLYEQASALLTEMNKCKVNIHDDVMKTNPDDLLSRNHQSQDTASNVPRVLANAPVDADTLKALRYRAATLEEEALGDRAWIGGITFSGVGLLTGGFAMKAFQAGFWGAGTALAGLTGLALGKGIVTRQRLASARNGINSRAEHIDIDTNPHFHPFKTRPETNLHIRDTQGRTKTFGFMIKNLFARKSK